MTGAGIGAGYGSVAAEAAEHLAGPVLGAVGRGADAAAGTPPPAGPRTRSAALADWA